MSGRLRGLLERIQIESQSDEHHDTSGKIARIHALAVDALVALEKPRHEALKAFGTPSGKRRIRQNVWGNWYGYEGTRRTKEFGTDALSAREWATVGVERPKSTGVIKLRNSTHPR